MAFARDTYVATGGQTDFTISFAYRSTVDIKLFQNGVELTVTTDYTFPVSTTVRLVTGATVGDVIVIQRFTSQNTPLVNFTVGTITEEDLDDNAEQLFNMAQEAVDAAGIRLGKATDEIWDAESIRIKNVAEPTQASDAATKSYADTLELFGLADASTVNVLATDSVTLRALGERFADTYNVLDHGLTADGVTDNVAAFDTLVAAVVATAKPSIIYFPRGDFKFDAPTAAIDMSFISLYGDMSKLDFSGAGATGAAFTLKGTVTATDRAATHFIRGFYIVGSGESGGLDCFNADATSPGVNRLEFADIYIEDFEDAIARPTDNFWGIKFTRISFKSNERHFSSVASGTGERIIFDACTFGRCQGYALDLQHDADTYYQNCSFDNNAAIIKMTKGRASFRDCHFEELTPVHWTDTVGPTFHIPVGSSQSTNMRIRGGQFTFGADAAGVEYIFRNDVAKTEPTTISVKDARIQNSLTRSGRLAGGEGRTLIRGCFGQNELSGKTMTGRSDNAMGNGNFSGGTIEALVGVRIEALNVPTTRVASPNLNITASTSAFRNWEFDANTDVTITPTNEITLTAHTMETGTPVIYNNLGGTDLGGLTTGTTYYIIRKDDDTDTVQLASSVANAWLGTAIAITTQPASETHELRSLTHGLLFTAAGTPGNGAKGIIAIPLIDVDIAVMAEFHVRHILAGSPTWAARYGQLIITHLGVEVVKETADLQAGGSGISGVEWLFKEHEKWLYADSEMTHFFLEFDLGSLAAAETLYVDNIVINHR